MSEKRDRYVFIRYFPISKLDLNFRIKQFNKYLVKQIKQDKWECNDKSIEDLYNNFSFSLL